MSKLKKEHKPKVHYTDIIDPEHFKNVTAPALFKLMEEARQIKENKKNRSD